MEISDTFSFLVGRWRIHRSITDHRSGNRGSFTGGGTFVVVDTEASGPRARRARYDETGMVSFGAHTGPASRQLEYIAANAGAVSINFADGRPFVDLDLRRGHWRSVHPCADDCYEITTTVQSPDVLEERWAVRGPTKSYDAVTSLTRIRGEEPGSSS